MGYLSKSLSPEQEIVVQLSTSADRAEVIQRLSIHGIRLKVLDGLSHGTYKIGVTAPAGLSPLRKPVEPFVRKSSATRCLVLTRNVGEEIVVTLREGAETSTVINWLESEGIAFQLNVARPHQCTIVIRAIDELLVLREELRGV